ncbi:MAG: hypothetical protein WBO37_11540 [Gammaproteobacteria bacterium]
MPDFTIIKHSLSAGLVYLLVFGALLVWPILRLRGKLPPDRLCVLKWLFWLQIFWLTVSVLATHYYHMADFKDWLHGAVYPYFVGAVSWLTVLAALLSLYFRSKRKDG